MSVKAFLFFLYTLSAVVLSFLPLYLAERGFDKLEIGLAMAVALVLGTASNLLAGLLSDRLQTLKSILLLLLAIQFGCSLVLFTASETWVIWIALQLFFISYTPLASMSDSLILLMNKQTGRSYVSYRLWGSIGFAVGAVVIGRLLQAEGLDVLWLMYGALSLLTISLCLPLQERVAVPSALPLRTVGELLLSKPMRVFLVLIFLLALSHRMNDHYLGLYMQQLGANETLIGWAWLASALSEIPMFLLLARIGARFRPLYLLSLAALLYGVRFLLMPLVTEPLHVVLVQCMHSVSFGVFLYASIIWLQTTVPEQFRATGQAVFTITWVSLSGITASAVGGWLFESFGSTVLYLAAAGFAGLASLLFVIFARAHGRVRGHAPKSAS